MKNLLTLCSPKTPFFSCGGFPLRSPGAVQPRPFLSGSRSSIWSRVTPVGYQASSSQQWCCSEAYFNHIKESQQWATYPRSEDRYISCFHGRSGVRGDIDPLLAAYCSPVQIMRMDNTVCSRKSDARDCLPENGILTYASCCADSIHHDNDRTFLHLCFDPTT